MDKKTENNHNMDNKAENNNNKYKTQKDNNPKTIEQHASNNNNVKGDEYVEVMKHKNLAMRHTRLDLNTTENEIIITKTLEEFRNEVKLPLKIKSNLFNELRIRLGMNMKNSQKAKQVKILNYHINRLQLLNGYEHENQTQVADSRHRERTHITAIETEAVAIDEVLNENHQSGNDLYSAQENILANVSIDYELNLEDTVVNHEGMNENESKKEAAQEKDVLTNTSTDYGIHCGKNACKNETKETIPIVENETQVADSKHRKRTDIAMIETEPVAVDDDLNENYQSGNNLDAQENILANVSIDYELNLEETVVIHENINENGSKEEAVQEKDVLADASTDYGTHFGKNACKNETKQTITIVENQTQAADSKHRERTDIAGIGTEMVAINEILNENHQTGNELDNTQENILTNVSVDYDLDLDDTLVTHESINGNNESKEEAAQEKDVLTNTSTDYGIPFGKNACKNEKKETIQIDANQIQVADSKHRERTDIAMIETEAVAVDEVLFENYQSGNDLDSAQENMHTNVSMDYDLHLEDTAMIHESMNGNNKSKEAAQEKDVLTNASTDNGINFGERKTITALSAVSVNGKDEPKNGVVSVGSQIKSIHANNDNGDHSVYYRNNEPKNDGIEHLKEDDLLNTQMLIDFSKHDSDFQLQATTEKSAENKLKDSNNDKDRLQNDIDTSLRNNREMKFSKKDFSPSGIAFTISRKEFDEITDPITKRLLTYKNLHHCRKNSNSYIEKKEFIGYHDLIRRINSECVMYIVKKKDIVPKKKPTRTITIQTVCHHITCKRFLITSTFKINDSTDITFQVLEDMKTTNHPEALGGQIRGKERVETKNALIQTRHKEFRRDQIILLPEESYAKTKDLGQILSESNNRKLASEARKDLRRHENQMTSLQLMARDNDTYIQWLSDKPFCMILMTKTMVDVILKATKKNGALDFHLDATGGAWSDPRTIGNEQRKLLMHSIITRFKCHESDKKMTTYPLAEIFTTDQSALNIQTFLTQVIGYMKKRTSRPLNSIVKTIVIDFSAAYIKAITESINLLSVIDYMKECYSLLEKRKVDPNTPTDLIFIRLCTSHLSKIVYKDIDEHFPDKTDKTAIILKIVLTTFFDIYNLDDIYNMVEALWEYILETNVGLKSKAYNALKNKVEKYTKMTAKNDTDIDSNYVAEIEQLFTECLNRNTIYESCPFYQRGLKEFEALLRKKSLSKERLKEDNPVIFAVIMLILQKYVTYIPMLSPVLTHTNYYSDALKNIEANRSNNGLIEAHHKDTKADIRNSIIVGNPPIRLDDHIMHIFKKDVETKTKMFHLAIPNSRTTRNVKPCRSTVNRKRKTPTSSQSSDSSSGSCIKSITNSDFMSNMRVSDLKKTKENFKKRSMRSENEGPTQKRKKVYRELFPEAEINKYLAEQHIYQVESSTHSQVSNSEDELLTPGEYIPARLSTILEERSENNGTQFSTILREAETGVQKPKSSKVDLLITSPSGMVIAQNQSIPHGETTDRETFEVCNPISASTPIDVKKKAEQYNASNKSVFSEFLGFSTFMENKLISDIKYYTRERPDSCNTLKIVCKGNKRLEYGDMRTLWSKSYTSWLSNFLIDYGLYVICSMYDGEVTRLNCNKSSALFGLREPVFENEKISSIILKHFSYSIILCPVLHNNHFTIAVIDQLSNEFHYFDSQSGNDDNGPTIMYEKLISILKKESKNSNNEFIKKALKMVSKLKVTNDTINYQMDSDHCGIHCINNAQMYLKKERLFDKSFDAIECRKQFTQFLLENSDSVENICFKCTRDDPYTVVNESKCNQTANILWIRCDQCFRWWHMDCAKTYGEHIVPEDSLSGFKCQMCIY